MSRGHSPAPPLPPKDSHSSHRTSFIQHQHQQNPPSYRHSTYRYTSHDDEKLAEAVRDTVHISAKSSNNSLRAQLQSVDHRHSHSPSPRNSANPLVPRRTPSPNTAAGGGAGLASVGEISGGTGSALGLSAPIGSDSSTTRGGGMSSSGTDLDFSRHQPILPSAMAAAQNPFEEDEIEPVGNGPLRPPGAGQASNRYSTGPPARQKFARAATGNLPPSPPTVLGNGTKTRARRSMSSDSYSLAHNQAGPEMRELTAGDKKGSRHADVIDTWDPTGLGSAMWHHSGPYDAAAPSRNTHIPPSKAPMSAFQGQPVTSPPKTTPTAISLASPPPPPPAANTGTVTARDMEPKRTIPPKASRRTSGGLTGQYSTSMPTSGGYFPDVSQLQDDAALARMERQKERDNKRRALKAAWGTDTPEPFEDFGGSPLDGMADLPEEEYSPDALPSARPLRSPGLRLGGLATKTPPIREDSTSPTYEHPPPTVLSGPGGAGQRQYSHGPAATGGVKRTKSLMQKIKTMRDGNRRAASPKKSGPITPTSEYPPVPALPAYSPDAKGKPAFFSRTSERATPEAEDMFEDAQETLPAASSGRTNVNGGEHVPVSSPKSAPRRQTNPAARSGSGSGSGFDLLDDDLADHPNATNGAPAFPVVNRVKNLPTPPVGPVLPSFDDLLIARHNSRSPAGTAAGAGAGAGSGAGGATEEFGVREAGGRGVGSGVGTGGSAAQEQGVRRKGSVVKKLKERIVR